MRYNKKGFTLVELMIVLVIIGIIAAFAIPSLLEANKSGNESSAEKSLRTIVDAEASFFKSDYDADGKDYAYILANLHDQLDAAGNMIALIPTDLAAGTKEGYAFGVIATYNVAGGTDDNYGYAYYAVPSVYPDTGRKTYIVNHEGRMYYKDQGAATIPAAWPDTAADATWLAVGE